MIRAYRGVWWMLGFPPKTETQTASTVTPPARQNRAGRKRLHRVTRMLLSVLPRRLQSALGVSTSITCSLSPEVRVSPTKPCGKGSKRKQDELEDDDDEEEQLTWVEALTQELAEDEGSEEDPDYQPTTIETESEEYCSHNSTESDIEMSEKGVIIIEDLKTEVLSTNSN
ncbi:oogenesis-related [Polymixia lowei]